jgi:competence ComEA-like helix-hairpin-helix protein
VTPGNWWFAVTAAYVAVGAVTAIAADPNPDQQAVQAVCGRCHTAAVFLNKPRAWDRWNDVFADMTQRGAKGTDEQLERVTRFFLENLTVVDVNTSAAEELAGVLGVSDEVAQSIIVRRQRQRFANITQLREIPGIDPDKLEKRKNRILFSP